MTDKPWENEDLPRAQGKIAPAEWRGDLGKWHPYKGNAEVVAELNHIKAQQKEILERLDKPIDTQVTGSIVEDVSFDSISLPSNSTYVIVNVREETADFRNLDVLLRWANGDIPDRFTFGVEYYHNFESTAIVGSEIDDVRDSNQLYEFNFRIKSPYFRIIVRNLDDVERTIRFGIITKAR